MRFWFVSLAILLLIPAFALVWRFVPAMSWQFLSEPRLVIADRSGDNIYLINLDFVTKTAFRVSFPLDLVINTASDKGEKRILDIIASPDTVWVKKSIMQSLGVPISMFVGDTNIWQKIWWWWTLRTLSIKDIDASKTSALEFRLDPDGHKVLVLSGNYEQLAGGWFASRTLVNDKLTLQIINTTNITGLGSRYASVANISGIKTGLILSSTDNLDQCVLVTSRDLMQSSTFKYLLNLFKCKTEENNELTLDIIFKLGTTLGE